MMKLSDTQRILLSTASQRGDGRILPLPGPVTPGGGAAKAVAALLKRAWQRNARPMARLRRAAPTGMRAPACSSLPLRRLQSGLNRPNPSNERYSRGAVRSSATRPVRCEAALQGNDRAGIVVASRRGDPA